MLSVRFCFQNSLDSLLSFRLSLSFLASSSAFLDCCFHLVISSSLDVPDRCLRYSVISFVIFQGLLLYFDYRFVVVYQCSREVKQGLVECILPLFLTVALEVA